MFSKKYNSSSFPFSRLKEKKYVELIKILNFDPIFLNFSIMRKILNVSTFFLRISNRR